MKDAGCRELQLGVESGSDDVLEAIRKKMTVDDLHRAFAMLRKHELRTKAFFILGHYHDRAEHLKRTMDLAVRLDPTWVFFSVMVPFPGTEDFRVAKERGFLETDDWERFNIHGKPILHTEHLSAAELGLARSRAYRRFYLRPRKVLRYLRDMIAAGDVRRMWGQLPRLSRLGRPGQSAGLRPRVPSPDAPGAAWIHVDMDSLAAIYRFYGKPVRGGADFFFRSAVDNAIAFLGERGLHATFFVVADELGEHDKKTAVDDVVRAGHRLASHSLGHHRLNRLPPDRLRAEIFDSKKKNRGHLRNVVRRISLAGVFADARRVGACARRGIRLRLVDLRHRWFSPPDAVRPFSGRSVSAVSGRAALGNSAAARRPASAVSPVLQHVSRVQLSFRAGFHFAARRSRCFTLLCHLTDFAAPERRGDGFILDFFTLNFHRAETKAAFLDRVIRLVGEHGTWTTAEAYLKAAREDVAADAAADGLTA
ncbi:MAG: polysaccharide deacetylase family protein [Deltaproteobacteria bacterium]|nr:polysaccharide deacetylase family protein [Deltaproteobacteria bacterium]